MLHLSLYYNSQTLLDVGSERVDLEGSLAAREWLGAELEGCGKGRVQVSTEQ